jgi:hypothetical protein
MHQLEPHVGLTSQVELGDFRHRRLHEDEEKEEHARIERKMYFIRYNFRRRRWMDYVK